MTDPFVGRWENLVYDGLEELKPELNGAMLDISADHGILWRLPHETMPTPGKLEDCKLSGDLLVGTQRCYFEVVACARPAGKPARRWIYGIFAIDRDGNGDLGDPGTWTAEESGPRGES